MSYEEEDTCMSYVLSSAQTASCFEEDTCMSYEEEDTCMSYEEDLSSAQTAPCFPGHGGRTIQHTQANLQRAYWRALAAGLCVCQCVSWRVSPCVSLCLCIYITERE
jgi:hypothetical protein